ncbi:MAG: peptidylprolyl isomerase [Methylacidiphilales bacterium]|nr:peptidylprolyl isomerase [Candidatus Methylacidiphilales bacterium]MDW8349643.1 peptidylprolyl isomerase [Verrucomicrobiae bacterium]
MTIFRANLFYFALLIHSLSATGISSEQKQSPAARPEEILVQAKSFTITRKDLDKELGFILRKLDLKLQTLTPVQRKHFEIAALKSVTRRMLLSNAAKEIHAADLEKKIEHQLQEYKEQFLSEDLFLKALEEQELTEQELKKQIADSIRIQELIRQRLPPPPSPSDQAVRQFFDQNKDKLDQPEMVRVSHISVLVPPEASADDRHAKRQALESIRQRVMLGEDFAKLAREISKEKNDGDLGWIARGTLGKEFDDVAFKLKPGQVSEIFATDRGFHFVMVRDRKEARKAQLDQLKPQIEQFLTQEAQLDAIDKLVAQLEKEENVRYLDKVASPTSTSSPSSKKKR